MHCPVINTPTTPGWCYEVEIARRVAPYSGPTVSEDAELRSVASTVYYRRLIGDHNPTAQSRSRRSVRNSCCRWRMSDQISSLFRTLARRSTTFSRLVECDSVAVATESRSYRTSAVRMTPERPSRFTYLDPNVWVNRSRCPLPDRRLCTTKCHGSIYRRLRPYGHSAAAIGSSPRWRRRRLAQTISTVRWVIDEKRCSVSCRPLEYRMFAVFEIVVSVDRNTWRRIRTLSFTHCRFIFHCNWYKTAAVEQCKRCRMTEWHRVGEPSWKAFRPGSQKKIKKVDIANMQLINKRWLNIIS